MRRSFGGCSRFTDTLNKARAVLTSRLKLNLIQAVRRKFGIKIFIIAAAFIFFISISFSYFYIDRQAIFLRNNLIETGRLLSGILAYNSRIGVFSENDKLLKDPVEGIFQHQEVLEASIVNLEGLLLIRQQAPRSKTAAELCIAGPENHETLLAQLKQSKAPIYREGSTCFEFWQPVVLGPAYAVIEPNTLQPDAVRSGYRIIGFVQIRLDKTILNRQIRDLLFKGILMGLMFLLLGLGIAYVLARSITKPMNKLTREVDALGRGGVVEKVPVETSDEIGKLAGAFNTMTESLSRRENALKESEARLRLLSARLINAQEKERKRVAKELHDELGQALAHLKHRVRSIQRRFLADPSALGRECEDISRYIDLTIENVRRLSRDLRPSVLEHLGLSAALRWLIEMFQKQHALQISVDMEDIDSLFSPEDQINLYRIFQEALTNIGKHAQAGRIFFAVKNEDHCVIFQIQDNGGGFDEPPAPGGDSAVKGMGLAAMKERAYMLGARLDIASRPGEGTSITLTVPTQKDE